MPFYNILLFVSFVSLCVSASILFARVSQWAMNFMFHTDKYKFGNKYTDLFEFRAFDYSYWEIFWVGLFCWLVTILIALWLYGNAKWAYIPWWIILIIVIPCCVRLWTDFGGVLKYHIRSAKSDRLDDIDDSIQASSERVKDLERQVQYLTEKLNK